VRGRTVTAVKKALMEWDEETTRLIVWLSSAVLPTEPFHLNGWTRVAEPQKFYEALRLDVAAGPGGPRAKALAQDLALLRLIGEQRRKAA